MKILILDDFALMRTVLRQALVDLNFREITECQTAQEAFIQLENAASQKKPYKLMFVDINMPDVNGLEVIKKCKSDPRYEKTAIVVFSAEQGNETVVAALEAGAANYIKKPISVPELKRKVEALIEAGKLA